MLLGYLFSKYIKREEKRKQNKRKKNPLPSWWVQEQEKQSNMQISLWLFKHSAEKKKAEPWSSTLFKSIWVIFWLNICNIRFFYFILFFLTTIFPVRYAGRWESQNRSPQSPRQTWLYIQLLHHIIFYEDYVTPNLIPRHQEALITLIKV